ncbi:MAG: MMPL family transporter [Bacteroidales bacterium]|nr:MMPL family transporter [Bacteroidales bacterium]MDZ4204238.1 MMPL family transporter [Bacteroidales bacterium]
MAKFIVRFRWWLIIIPVIISLLMLVPLKNARINPDLKAYLPAGIEAKVSMEKMEEIFGKNDPVIIFFGADDVLNDATLERIQNLTRAFDRMKEFSDVMSLFKAKYVRGLEGSMVVDPVVKRIPTTYPRREQLRAEIIDNPLVYKLLITEDFTYTLLMLTPTDITDIETFRLINEKLTEFPGDERIMMAGDPYLRYEVQQKATRDLTILLPIGLLVMIVFLYLSFREKRGVLLPLAVVAMSIILSMGLMPVFGYELSLIAVLVPILMIAVANNYGVHIVSRYQELNAMQPTWSMKKITLNALDHLNKPIILTALTTIVGILGLVVHVMLPAIHMGIVSSIGIAFALTLSLLFIPAMMVGMKKGKIQKSFRAQRITLVDKLLAWAGKVTTQWPKLIVFVFASVLIAASLGVFKLQVSINNENMLPPSHPLRVAINLANKNFGGSHTLSMLFEGDIKDPSIMQTMDRFETELETLPEVGHATSLATVIRTISRALNEPGDEFYDVIPDSREAIAQYIEFYSMSGDPDDFDKFVDFDYSKALMNVQFRAEDMKTFDRVLDQINGAVNSTPTCTMKSGSCLLQKQLAESIVRGQIYSLVIAMLAIFMLLWLIFKSFWAGLLGSIPLFFTLLCNFGLMGWIGLELDIATALISSIAIGIGVDYTIHIFWRIKAEMAEGKTHSVAIIHALRTTGRGITINAFSVMLGFSVLFLSALVLLKSFGFLIIFSLSLCLLCALLLIPAICLVFKPSFLKKSSHYKIK